MPYPISIDGRVTLELNKSPQWRAGVHEQRGANRGMCGGNAVSSGEMRSVRGAFFFCYFSFGPACAEPLRQRQACKRKVK